MTHRRRTQRRPPPDAQRLRELRLAAGLRQRDIADALGIAQPSYARRESGRTRISPAERVMVAYLVGMDPAEAFPDAFPATEARADQ